MGLAVAALVLLVPYAHASSKPQPLPTSAIFYYPWFGNPAHDGAYDHWQQNGHDPAGDIASAYYPSRGAYSSSDPSVLDGSAARDRARGHRRDRRLVVGARLADRRAAARGDRCGASALGAGRGTSRAVRGPQRRECRRRHRVPPHARDRGLLRVPRDRLPGRSLGAADDGARRRAPLRADAARGVREAGRLRGHLHVRHAHVSRAHVQAHVHAGAPARAALPALGRPRLQRAARDRRRADTRAQRRAHVRLDVERRAARRRGRRRRSRATTSGTRARRSSPPASTRGTRATTAPGARAASRRRARTSTARATGSHASYTSASAELP